MQGSNTRRGGDTSPVAQTETQPVEGGETDSGDSRGFGGRETHDTS